MIARVNLAVVAVGLVVVLAAGCGGSGDGESAATQVTTSSLSKAQFVEKANVACGKEKQKLLGRVAAYKPPANSSGESAEEKLAVQLTTVIVPTVEGEIAAIQALGAPEGEEEDVEAILAAQQKGIEEISALTAVKSVRDITTHFDEATKLAKQYGISTCTVTPEPNAPEVGG